MFLKLLQLVKRALFTRTLVAGQVWRCQARPQDKNATITVLKLDDTESGQIVSVRIEGIEFKNPLMDGGLATSIEHLPIAELSLKHCLIDLKESNRPVSEELLEGYYTWKEEYAKGNAGCFDIPISEIIDMTEETIANCRPSQEIDG